MVVVNILEDNAKFISPNQWFGLDLLQNPDNVLLTTVSLVNCSETYLGNVTYPASTTQTEVRISTLSNSDKISGLVLMNGSVIYSNAITIVRVNVSVSTLANGTATVHLRFKPIVDRGSP